VPIATTGDTGSAGPHPTGGIAWPVLGITDRERSLDFYCGVLGLQIAGNQPQQSGGPGRTLLSAGGRALMLEAIADPEPSEWVDDDLQRGMRHVGFKVDDIEPWADRVRAAGAPFTMEPRDAFGDVRIAFFLDPDGAHLELVQGNVGYTHPGSPELVARERALPAPATPRFDHVALSVADLPRTLACYRRGAGAALIGELYAADDPRGFRITYLQAGPAILELFSFDRPLRPNPWRPGRVTPGLLRIGLSSDDPARAAAMLLEAGGSHPAAGGPDADVVLDPDGTPLEIAAAPVAERRSRSG
jgi:catechol 2,3-dioxygenase-like lactoylglutathione lyase family enzyme